MVELIEWMRNYNLSHDPNESVRFYGIDMQGGYRDLEYLADVAKRDPAFYEAADSEKLISLAADEEPDLTAEHDFFESLSQKLAGESDAEHRTAAVIAGTVLQWVDAPRYSEDPAGYGLYRDTCMAKNLMDYYNIELSRGYDQILVTAHNGHVAKGPDTAMGSCINELFEGSYYCIGTDFYNTVVNVHTAGTYDENYQRADHEYCSDSPMAYQAQFFKNGRYCLDLKSITDPGNKIYKLIHKPNFTGLTGEGYNPMWEIYKSYRARIVAVDHYDAMIYYYNTTPIRPIHY